MSRKPPPRIVQVIRKQELTPHMLRLTLGGDALQGFPTGQQGANIKLLLPHPNQPWQSYLDSLAGSGQKPVKRTYTIRRHDSTNNELEVDFALHFSAGPATLWARQVKLGEQIAIAGPGRLSSIDPAADWFLVAGDLCALPAILTNIERMPATASGTVFVELQSEADQQAIELPAGVKLTWIINPDLQSDARQLITAVKAVSMSAGHPSIWIAGESSMVKTLRKWLANELGIDPANRYTSGYWHIGHNEDSFQPIKRQQM